jgi:predicted NAD-dependent protein-ADP-ribosyltransferase YbiA (DUF1768 family)
VLRTHVGLLKACGCFSEFTKRSFLIDFTALNGEFAKYVEVTDYELFQDTVTYRPIIMQLLDKPIPAEANAGDNRTSIARQRISKHASLT